MISEILLRRKNKINIERQNEGAPYDTNMNRYILSVVKNIESLGYSLGCDVINTLLTYDYDGLVKLYNELIPMLKKLRGADVQYNPMYPNFPQQVAEASDGELFINAIIHYFSGGVLMPDYAKNERMPLIDDNNFTVLSIGGIDDICDIFSNLVASKTSLSEQDREDMKQLMRTYPDCLDHMPDEVPLKENVALVATLLLQAYPHGNYKCIVKYFKTATDVLRFIVQLSDGDTSLAAYTNFKHLHRPERRMVMYLLSECGDIIEDMYRYRDEWIRIGEILHVFEFKSKRFNRVRAAFDVLRNKHKPVTYLTRVEEHIKNNDIVEAVGMLTYRPGEFARRMDKLLRSSTRDQQQYVINSFAKVADKVSTQVLLQLRQAFIGRQNKRLDVRVFFPKGMLAKATSIPNTLPPIRKNVCEQVVNVCNKALIGAYKQRDPMGCVYIDEELKNYIVPFSQRSASSGNKVLIRGSRVPIKKDATTIRGFVWWTNTKKGSRVDIDLSCCVLDENFNKVTHVSYTNLRDDAVKGYHSGDIVNGGVWNGKGVAEFVDVDIDSVLRHGGRYICYNVYSFTQQKFSEIENCRFGWMEREMPGSGEIFEPSTVEMRIDLKSESTVAVPVLFDCLEREFIWMDMNVSMNGFTYANNIENNLLGVKAVAYSIVNINKANMYDLVYLNALARGCIVSDRGTADIIFSNDTMKPTVVEIGDDGLEHTVEKDVPIVTAYDVDYYMGKLL